MQIDFHYSAIRVIAEKAGFKPEEAQIIAYSSQFVDDATEHKSITIPQKIYFDFYRLKNNVIDPICTAHKGLQFLNDFKKEVQEKIYLSYHFVPPKKYNGTDENYSYLVSPNNEMVNLLVNQAINDLKKHRNSYNLIKLGIALHSYADSWSHSHFSGIYSPKDNDIEHIKIFDGKQLKKINPFRQFSNNLLPSIGHAEASHYPDLPFLKWSFVKAHNPKEEIVKNNPKLFLEAAKNIFQKLCKLNHCTYNWKFLETKLWIAFNFISYEAEERMFFYNKIFPEINFNYNPNEWKNDILNPPKFTDKKIKIKQNLYWLEFQKAADYQRNLVLSLIKRL